MDANSTSYSTIFAKNRAEEMPDDVWGKYVLPINYKEVSLNKWTKATVIIGGRGSGKTMFLKYHCHPTIFSKKRTSIDIKSLNMIGLYWRPDTSFTQLLNEKWLGKSWNSAFISFMCLSILIEFSRLINNIIASNIKNEDLKSSLKNLKLPKVISDSLLSNNNKSVLLKDAEEALQVSLFHLCSWINLPKEETPPINLDLKLTLGILTKAIISCSDLMNDSIYHIYIDEFENLTQPQQKIINTWMKHGIPPLLFSSAYKKNAEVTHETIGVEKIVPRNDYRILDLESVFSQDFELLAAEVLALRLAEKKDIVGNDFLKYYSDELILEHRNDENYKKSIKGIATQFLPEISHQEISKNILNDSVLMRKLFSLIEDGLKSHKSEKYNTLDFIDTLYPEASLINGVLLNRKSNHPDNVIIEFYKYKLGNSEKYKNWISNNLVGAILYLYSKSSSKYCPLYAGFRQFVLMSKGNLRHFLELCHQSILKAEFEQLITDSNEISTLSVETQAKATFMTSSLELEKISDLGANGMHLKRVARRLGILFSHSQNRRSQSEPEINHFTLDLSDKTQLSEKTQKLLNEALVWSVLFEEESTKTKSEDTTETKDYILHPVLSACFKISYRKKRKLKLKAIEIEAIFNGEEDDFLKMIKTYKDRWGINSDENISESLIKDSSGEQLGLL